MHMKIIVLKFLYLEWKLLEQKLLMSSLFNFHEYCQSILGEKSLLVNFCH